MTIKIPTTNFYVDVFGLSDVNWTRPSLVFLSNKKKENDKGEFPYKVYIIYYADNPKKFLYDNPPIILDNIDNILILNHQIHINTEEELSKIKTQLEGHFEI